MSNTPEDTELDQKITDICLDNGGVTKPMADKLMHLITLHTQKARIDELDRISTYCELKTYQGDDYVLPRMNELTNPTEAGEK